jgi:hypothetical protein
MCCQKALPVYPSPVIGAGGPPQLDEVSFLKWWPRNTKTSVSSTEFSLPFYRKALSRAGDRNPKPGRSRSQGISSLAGGTVE